MAFLAQYAFVRPVRLASRLSFASNFGDSRTLSLAISSAYYM